MAATPRKRSGKSSTTRKEVKGAVKNPPEKKPRAAKRKA